MRLLAIITVAIQLACGGGANPAFAQQQKVTFKKVFSALTTPLSSQPLQQIGQCMHIFVVLFPTAVADVTNIQVRIEASYDNVTYFPISPDITNAQLLGGTVYRIEKAYGVFPYVRARSLLSTPGALPMDVQYAGHIIPVVPVLFEAGDRFIL